MTEEQKTQNEPTTSSSSEAWREVGEQFGRLGESIATVFRSAWESEQNQKVFQEVQSGLESMSNAVTKAIDDVATSPEGQKIREEATRAATSAREAGEKAVQEVRPQLISALRQAGDELDALVQRLKQSAPDADAAAQDEEPGGES